MKEIYPIKKMILLFKTVNKKVPIIIFCLLAYLPIIAQNECVDANGNRECAANFTLTVPRLDAVCGEGAPCPPVFDIKDCSSLAFNFEVRNTQIDNNPILVEEITWTILDWCHADIEGMNEQFEIPLLDIDGDGVTGDIYNVIVSNDSIFLELPNELLYVQQYFGIMSYRTSNRLVRKDVLINVFADDNANCQKEEGERRLDNWQVQILSKPSNVKKILTTNDLGRIEGTVFLPEDDKSIEVSVVTPINLGGQCQTTKTYADSEKTSLIEADFPINLVNDCQLLTVDIATPFLRRCFSNTYTVHYCNYSAETILGGQIEVILDEFLEMEESELTFTNPEQGGYVFELSDIVGGDCQSFTFKVKVSCDAELGQTHCAEARIFPAETCVPNDPQWTGASIAVEGFCEGDSVRFRIKNVGKVDMLKESGFIVTEDVLMLKRGAFQLGAGASEVLSFPANGATYHLMAEQEDFHPGRNHPSVHVEGCGGINSPGLVNAIAQNDADLFVSKDCQPNIGAFDPNDKSAVPTGIGTLNYIPKNTDIDYKIRFQNTGTDTAFNIVILDTLSQNLDAASVLPGAASHDYQFALLTDPTTNAKILSFSFDNIMLPDSNINEVASNGFVQFSIAQQLDLADETELENTAAIYFDFNEPVITNTVFHTIGMPIGRFVTDIDELILPTNRKIQFSPNPFYERTTMVIGGPLIKKGKLQLYDLTGKLIQEQSFSGSSTVIYRNNLTNGIYFYKVFEADQLLNNGKLILQK